MNWMFDYARLNDAVAFHGQQGFVGFSDALSPDEFTRLRDAADAAEERGRLHIGQANMELTNDAIYADPEIEKACRHPRIVDIARRLIGHPIELQHAKFSGKPAMVGGGDVAWHQDYPFYPHTNFDLVSAVIHLDDESEALGAMRFIPGSHHWGVLSHLEDGKFAYRCTGRDDLDAQPSVLTACPAGGVTFHHALTLHYSGPKRVAGKRRLIVFQYRAFDAVQLAGVVWKCAGHRVDDTAEQPRTARFSDGTAVELRGRGGRLIDMSGALAPDR